MPDEREGRRRMTLWLPVDVWEAIEGVMRSTGRTMTDELVDAARRHAAQPPRVLVERPPLRPAEVVRDGRPRRGRPPGSGRKE